jgi:hypothetical protein
MATLVPTLSRWNDGLAVHSVGSLPPEKQSTPAATQLASLLAESVDPFLHRGTDSKRSG